MNHLNYFGILQFKDMKQIKQTEVHYTVLFFSEKPENTV